MLEQPMTFLKTKVSGRCHFSAGDHEPERRIFTLCITGDDPARDVCFSGRTGLSGAGNCDGGSEGIVQEQNVIENMKI